MSKEKKTAEAPQEEKVQDTPVQEEELEAPQQEEGEVQTPDPVQDALLQEQNKFLRLAAEYDNYRKRTAKEKEGIYANAKIDTIQGMLPVYDNLERGLAQFKDEDDDPHKKGLEMIFNQYKEALTKLGVTPIDCVGKEFDPERHNAVMHIEDESLGENTVAEVLQQGFMLGEKVLRFAIVKVAN